MSLLSAFGIEESAISAQNAAGDTILNTLITAQPTLSTTFRTSVVKAAAMILSPLQKMS